ncbi:hypothetical protein PHYC_02222 [Phycisphaerales bacterium]|nr:hypothetical protein PHYC_02222 [Phycisphaerales bacterium]
MTGTIGSGAAGAAPYAFGMGLSLNIPIEAEQTLRQAFGADLDRAALEALVNRRGSARAGA